MIELVISHILNIVGDLLIQERAFLGDVSGKIEQLKTQLVFMQGFLKDANKRQDEDERVRICVSQIRELAYDAEDVIQSFFVTIIEPRQQDGFRNTLKKYASIPIDAVKLHTLGNEIEEINGKITDLTLSLQTYKILIDVTLGSTSTSTSTSGIETLIRTTYGHTDEEYTIVGLDYKDIQILLEKLIDQSKRHQVISICGMGGLGKSTLAKKLFKHIDVTNHFNHFAWVFVSQTFLMRQIMQDILIQLKSPLPAEKARILELNDREIAGELYELQKAKKCLVVIDDLWKKEDWDALKHAFPIGNIVGAIVLTTRNKTLGEIVDSKSFIHEPRTLTNEESWSLFQMKAFPRNDYTYFAEMEKLGEEMVKLCKGLPLAIIVLGGVLATKSSLGEWNSARQNFGMYLRKGETSSSEYSTIDAVLALSYTELPYHLKPCFLSLSQFPEDSSISTRTLFQLWMAESIVTNQSYGEAQGYLQQLIDRCLVQIEVTGFFGGIKSCRLHDLIHDLTISKANKENFFKIIDVETTETSTVFVNPQRSKARKVDLCSHRRVLVGPQNRNRIAENISLQKNICLRTLVGQNCELEASLGDFKMLRTLRLTNCKIGSIKEIGKLIHLKYLSLEKSSIDHIPSSLLKLRYLQTFILQTNADKLKISKKVWNSQELRYISIQSEEASGYQGELELGDLPNLQTLRASAGLSFGTNVKNLPNLKKLQTGTREERSLSEVRNALSTLYLKIEEESGFGAGDVEEILLGCGQLQELCLDGRIEKLPNYHPDFTPKLTKLTLVDSELKEDPMPVLEKFPNLTFLHLVHDVIHNSIERVTMVCSSNGFPQLKTLKLELLGMFDWQVNEGAMPNLSHLFIERCEKLKMLPDGIKNLSYLNISYMPKRFTRRVEERGRDCHKIPHVICITVTKSAIPSEDEKLYAYSDDSEEEPIDESSGEEEYHDAPSGDEMCPKGFVRTLTIMTVKWPISLSCRLHDLTLSLSKANQENFLEIIDVETHRVLAGPQISQARRVLVGPQNQNRNVDLISLQKNHHLRTLIGQNCELKASSLGDFKMLRTLRLINCEIRGNSIKEIGKLIHLKYLSIDKSFIDHIPSSLANLRYLQTFIFHTDAEVLKISKKIFANFQELRYISITWMETKVNEAELKLGDLTNLRTIRTFGRIRIKSLESLPNLKTLQIKSCDLKSHSKVLHGLSSLYLDNGESGLSEEAVEEIFFGCPQLQKLDFLRKIEKLPKYHQHFTPKLTKLTLQSSDLKEDPMPLLEKFLNLTFLHLSFAFGGRIRMVEDDS